MALCGPTTFLFPPLHRTTHRPAFISLFSPHIRARPGHSRTRWQAGREPALAYVASVFQASHLGWPCLPLLPTGAFPEPSLLYASRVQGHSHTPAAGAKVIPELVCKEDDPPFQKQGGKYTDQVADTEAGEERLEIHVFEPGVQRAAQLDHLPGNRSSYEDCRLLSRPLPGACTPGALRSSAGVTHWQGKRKEKEKNRRDWGRGRR